MKAEAVGRRELGAAQPTSSHQQTTPAAASLGRCYEAESSDSASHDNSRPNRRRLVVLGDTAFEVVCAAGGLIYDRSSEGWDVTVHLATLSSDKALQILGAKTTTLTSRLQLHNGIPWPDAIFASPLVYRHSLSVRDYFTRALLRSCAATAMLGDEWPVGLGKDVGRITYRLSPAARAFKRQAMLAADRAAAARDHIETLRGCPQHFTSHRFAATPA